MAEQCFTLARRKWNETYKNNQLTYDAGTGPELWAIAKEAGYRTTRSAISKAIACWDDGGAGHVAWVLNVNKGNTMTIIESNWPLGAVGVTSTIDIGDRSGRTYLGCVYL